MLQNCTVGILGLYSTEEVSQYLCVTQIQQEIQMPN